jgi:hypothetical protein
MNYKGRRLLGVDGVSIRTYTNPQSISFMPSNTNKRSGYNAYSGVVFLDLLTHIPVDIALSPISRLDELGGALSMLAFNPLPTPSIITADRLYGNSYAFLADLLETPNADFVIRTKQGAGAMKFLRDLPMEEFDIRKQVVLTDSQSQASRDRGEIFISTGSKRGKVNSPNTYVSRFSHPLPYILNLRITRIRLKNGEYETLLSSLSQEEFTAEDLREIYKLRWKIELYFRHIKHDCGLIAMHSKIEDYSRQQIYAAFLFSSAVWKIVNSIVLQQKDSNKHEYAVNIKMATYLVRNFLRDPNADSEKLLHDLTRYIVPIRPDRSYDRQLIPIPMKSFCYRVA